ncbi:MAG: type II toxin-antitoxin system VapB family antitoxin [Calditrichales bacterium]|nr:type II toxin-antitoxin system VapB family antitoxin [Calditrichales bacterium]
MKFFIMRTNIDIDNNLIKKAKTLSNIKTKKEIIHLALKEFIKSKERLNLMDLIGKIEFADGYDYKNIRNKIS